MAVRFALQALPGRAISSWVSWEKEAIIGFHWKAIGD
jgi:hypothetical protein